MFNSKSSSRWPLQSAARTVTVAPGPRPHVHASAFRHISGNVVKNRLGHIVFLQAF